MCKYKVVEAVNFAIYRKNVGPWKQMMVLIRLCSNARENHVNGLLNAWGKNNKSFEWKLLLFFRMGVSKFMWFLSTFQKRCSNVMLLYINNIYKCIHFFKKKDEIYFINWEKYKVKNFFTVYACMTKWNDKSTIQTFTFSFLEPSQSFCEFMHTNYCFPFFMDFIWKSLWF